jgi:hypothetical protein
LRRLVFWSKTRRREAAALHKVDNVIWTVSLERRSGYERVLTIVAGIAATTVEADEEEDDE